MVADFRRRVAGLAPDPCYPFHQEAGRLEAELLTVYKMAALAARREQDLNCVSAIWGTLLGVCDAVARELNMLIQRHPACGADEYYDRVLDLRNKCNRLQQMHS